MKKMTHNLKIAVSLLLAVLFVMSALAGCGNASSDSEGADSSAAGTETTETSSDGYVVGSYEGELRPLREAVSTGVFDHYIALIGTHVGIFEKYGIDLTFTEYSMGINTIDAIVEGISDVGILGDYALANRIGNTQHDTNLVAFSEMFGMAPGVETPASLSTGLYVAPQYVDNLEALDGSEGFATITGTVFDYFNSKIFDYLGIEEENQNIIATDSVQSTIALAATGGASAAYAYGATAEYFQEYGWQIVATSDEMGISTNTFYMTTSDFTDENLELLADFLAAAEETFAYIQANLEECGEYLETQLGVDKDTFISDYTSYASRIGFSEETVVALEDVVEWAYEHGRYDEPYNIRDFIDTRALELYKPESVTIAK